MKKRENYLSWDDYFMGIAYLSSYRSKDPGTQVGACIVSQDNRIISIGYNGSPRGYDDDLINWSRQSDISIKETKYPYVCHSELNAIINYRGSANDLVGSKVYVTLFPCNECAKVLVQAGVKEVIYAQDKYKDQDIYQISRQILTECGVSLRQYSISDTIVIPKGEE